MLEENSEKTFDALVTWVQSQLSPGALDETTEQAIRDATMLWLTEEHLLLPPFASPDGKKPHDLRPTTPRDWESFPRGPVGTFQYQVRLLEDPRPPSGSERGPGAAARAGPAHSDRHELRRVLPRPPGAGRPRRESRPSPLSGAFVRAPPRRSRAEPGRAIASYLTRAMGPHGSQRTRQAPQDRTRSSR